MRVLRISAAALAAVLVVSVAILLWQSPRSEPTLPVVVPPTESGSVGEPVPAATSVPLEPGRISDVAAGSRRPAVVGPHGKVLEAGTNRPIEGLSVRMKFAGKALGEAVTGTDGSFFLPEPERSRLTVQVDTEEWRVTPKRVRLDEDQSAGTTELLFRGERIVATPLRGRLVDRRTDEPVPEFLIQARGPRSEAPGTEAGEDPDEGGPLTVVIHGPPRRVEYIVTDADGRFESGGGFEAGLLDLVLADHRSLLKGTRGDDEHTIEYHHVFDRANPPEDVVLEVSLGPTYRFALALPGGKGVDDFYATFPVPTSALRDIHRVLAGDRASPMAMFYGSAQDAGGLEQKAPLREGSPLWVRFRDPILTLDESSEGDRVLHVRSRDGYWSGSAPVSSVVGVVPEVVPITLEARGAVAGTILDHRGEAVPTAWIQLVGGAAPSSPLREVGADRKGRFDLRWLAEGDYDVVVQTDRFEESWSRVSIVPGTTVPMEVRLTSLVPLGTVSGVLRSRTGQHHSKGGIVSLKSLDDRDLHMRKSVSYRRRQGQYTAAFTFEDVPSGNYELRLRPLDNMRWETLTMRVSPPAEGLEFICEDDVPTFDLEFRAIDAQTGAAIEEAWNIVWRGDPLEDLRLDDDWETGLYKGVPEGVPLLWMLGATGYRLAVGDESAARAEADHRVVEARLDPGWGQVFKVTTPEREPLEGVELMVDGDSLGVTDARGMVLMNLNAKPGELEFRYGDWVVTWGRVDPEEVGFGWGPQTPVYMEPGR